MSLRTFSVGCAGILLLLGTWAVFGTVRSFRKRRWRGIFFALVALCLFAIAAAPVSYLAGFDSPHAVHNKPAPVSDSAITYYYWGGSSSIGHPPSQLIALRARTGAILWQKSLPTTEISVDAGGDTLYGVSQGATTGSGGVSAVVVALDGATGATRWQSTVNGVSALGAPQLVGGTLLLGVGTYGVKPILIESTPTPIGITPNDNTPTPVPTTLPESDAGIVALRPSDGQELWRVSLGPMGTTNLPIIGGTNGFYDLLNNNIVQARSLSDGHLLWATWVVKGISLAGADPIYALSYDGSVTALSPTDGAIRWNYGDHEVYGPAALSGGMVIVDAQQSSSTPATVYALDAATGVVRWSFATHSTSLYILLGSDDTVYVPGASGLYALRTVDGSVRWRAGAAKDAGISEFTPMVGSALYVTHIATLPSDAIISFAPPKQQVYLSAVDTRDGSLCWSVPVGPVFGFQQHL